MLESPLSELAKKSFSPSAFHKAELIALWGEIFFLKHSNSDKDGSKPVYLISKLLF